MLQPHIKLSVQLPLGTAEVSLDRQGLDLADRGGFEARWSLAEKAITLEEFHQFIKSYLNALYQQRYGKDAPKIILNLAAHQLVEDVIGWGKLNDGKAL